MSITRSIDSVTAPARITHRYCATMNRSNDPHCAVPLPSQRTKPAIGTSFSDFETNGHNLYYARTVVNAITSLAATAKAVSDGKLFTVSFYGYLFALADSRLAGASVTWTTLNVCVRHMAMLTDTPQHANRASRQGPSVPCITPFVQRTAVLTD